MARTTVSATKAAAVEFARACVAAGFTFSTRPGIVRIDYRFTPGDRDAYVFADGEGPALISQVPTVASGSVWGTDGATIGGAVGLTNGHYTLRVSGASKRFCAALASLA